MPEPSGLATEDAEKPAAATETADQLPVATSDTAETKDAAMRPAATPASDAAAADNAAGQPAAAAPEKSATELRVERMLADSSLPLEQRIMAALVGSYEAWYTISWDYPHHGRTFPAFAAFHQHGERYVLSKRAKLWGISNHEYLFFDHQKHLDAASLQASINYMKNQAITLVDPDEPEHMSTNLVLILVVDSASPEALELLRKTRHRKNFSFGFKGWSDLKLVVVALNHRQLPEEEFATIPQGKAAELLADIQVSTNPGAQDLVKILIFNVESAFEQIIARSSSELPGPAVDS